MIKALTKSEVRVDGCSCTCAASARACCHAFVSLLTAMRTICKSSCLSPAQILSWQTHVSRVGPGTACWHLTTTCGVGNQLQRIMCRWFPRTFKLKEVLQGFLQHLRDLHVLACGTKGAGVHHFLKQPLNPGGSHPSVCGWETWREKFRNFVTMIC
jgi:hypothetical protein